MENKKMIVNVYQKHGNGKKALVNVWEDETTNILQLTAFLYRKTILKSGNFKIYYKYNYSDLQTITIAETFTNYDESTTTTYFEFINVPTKLAYLDIYKLEKRSIRRLNKMKVKKFQVNYKTYKLYYTEEQKAKIDYMRDWKNTIARLRWLIKNNKIREDSDNVGTSYIARAIDNYSFFIKHLTDNQFIIQDGHFWEM